MELSRKVILTTTVSVLALLLLPLAAYGNMVNDEKEIYIVRPLITEPAWTQTGFYFNTMLFDQPNAVSRPNAQVGFVFTPGITWSVMDILELNVGFPMVLNPDATGNRELDAAKTNPELKQAPQWDDHPDFDLPGLYLGLKGKILGKPGEDKFFLAVGVSASLNVFETWSTSFGTPMTEPGHSNSHRFNPYVSLAYQIGKFSPQLQLGACIRLPETYFDPENPPAGATELPSSGYTDFFFNLALPFAFVFERTAPMIEINGVFGEQGTQLFITPAVTFMPKGSAALLSFAAMLPVLDTDFRKNEGFRFLVNFSYRIDALSIPSPWAEDKTEGGGSEEKPPANW